MSYRRKKERKPLPQGATAPLLNDFILFFSCRSPRKTPSCIVNRTGREESQGSLFQTFSFVHSANVSSANYELNLVVSPQKKAA